MEFSTDIKFSCNLIKNKNTTITYSGFLYKNNSEAVTMVYGFGDSWEKTTEQKMEKTDKGFVTRINLLNFDKLNFCFRNSNYVWDNNNNQNYGCPIKDAMPITTSSTTEDVFDDAFIINENVIGGILTNLFENNISNMQNIKPQVKTPILQTPTVKSEVKNIQNLESKVKNNIQDIKPEIDNYTFGSKNVKPQIESTIPEVLNIETQVENDVSTENIKYENVESTIQDIEFQDVIPIDDDIEIEDISIEGEVAEGIKIENIFDTMFIEPISSATISSYNSNFQDITNNVENVVKRDNGTTEIDRIIESFKTPVENTTTEETIVDTYTPQIVENTIENTTPTIDENTQDTYTSSIEIAVKDIENNTSSPDESNVDTYESLLKSIKEDYYNKYGKNTDTYNTTEEIAEIPTKNVEDYIPVVEEKVEEVSTESVETPAKNIETYSPVVNEKVEKFSTEFVKTLIENIETYPPTVNKKVEDVSTESVEAPIENIETYPPTVNEKVEDVSTEAVETPIENIETYDSVATENDDSFYIDVEKNETLNIEDTIVNTTEVNKLNRQIEKSFDDIYLGEDYTTNNHSEAIKKEVTKFDMNGLIDEILSPVIKSSNFADNFNRITVEEPQENVSNTEIAENEDCSELIETIDKKFEELQSNTEASLIEEALNNTTTVENIDNTINETENEQPTTALTTVKDDSFMVSPRSLGTFYMLRKKIKLAFYKIFGILPRLLFDYDEEN